MLLSAIVLVISSVVLATTRDTYTNKFESTNGCLQYNSKEGYKHPHPYLPTDRFRNVRVSAAGATKIRLGVLAKNDGHFRFAPIEYPYDSTSMYEIVLSGWANTRSVVRRYTRKDAETTKDIAVLKDQSSGEILSEYSPFMFTLSLFRNGTVQLTADGDTEPFMDFHDQDFSFQYLSFCNWDVPAIYFFDCPFEQRSQRGCENDDD